MFYVLSSLLQYMYFILFYFILFIKTDLSDYCIFVHWLFDSTHNIQRACALIGSINVGYLPNYFHKTYQEGETPTITNNGVIWLQNDFQLLIIRVPNVGYVYVTRLHGIIHVECLMPDLCNPNVSRP